MLVDEKEKEEIQLNSLTEISTTNQIKYLDIFKTFLILVSIFLLILIILFIIFTIYNKNNTKFASGIYVKGIDISGLTYEEAKLKVKEYININMKEDINVVHGEYNTTINITQIEAKFNVDDAIDQAYNYTRTNNIFKNNLVIFNLIFSPINIEPALVLNEEQLELELDTISTQLPDTVIESSYYIEDDNLIITAGKTGLVVNIPEMKNYIIDSIRNLSYINNDLEIITKSKEPQKINIEKIHDEIYKKPKDAYYSLNPRVVYPSENGIDFNIQEAKNIINKENKEEYTIPLKTLYPNVTTKMIGMEAFPDLISSFSTKYSTSNRNRTTNLIIASNKINGTVLMPGETFSFNQIVGKRTIEAGYKDAAIYQDGKVVDGLAGGICQISTTLFNCAVYANLDIIQRRNHQFVPSYVSAGRDATVVYGSQDFKFKNTRNYPIKIVCSVGEGLVKFSIYGLRENTEYQVEIIPKITSRTSSSIHSITYKILKLNNQIIKSEILCKDTYKIH